MNGFPGALPQAAVNAALLALNADDLGVAVSDRGFRIRSTHSEEGSINTSSVGFENLADAQWQ
jgi:hypothetical protein